MAGGVEWVPDRAGIARFEERDPELNASLAALARQAVAYAKRIAPVGTPAEEDEHPGAYRDSIQYEKREEGPGYRIFSDDEKAHWIEYGAQHMRRHSVLTRAVGTISGNDFASFG